MPARTDEDEAIVELIETVKTPDPQKDPAKEIEENGEPFEGNNA